MSVALSKLIHHDAATEQQCKPPDPARIPVTQAKLCDAVIAKDPVCTACKAQNSIFTDWCRGFTGEGDTPIIIVGMHCKECCGCFTYILYMHDIVGD
jgi:hypothetical protein